MTTTETKKSRLNTVRKVTKFVTGTAVSGTVTMLVKQNTMPANKLQAVELVIGTFMLSTIATKKSNDYVDNYFDNLETQSKQDDVINVTTI